MLNQNLSDSRNLLENFEMSTFGQKINSTFGAFFFSLLKHFVFLHKKWSIAKSHKLGFLVDIVENKKSYYIKWEDEIILDLQRL